MATLAIKGEEYNDKVIEIFEMLGGRNTNKYTGYSNLLYYYINKDGIIEGDRDKEIPFPCICFTLEEFLHKFPYKVGDKVKNARINDFIGRITNARWDNNEEQIIYTVEWDDKSILTYFARGLQPYKEETMENKPNMLQQLKDYFNNTPREVIEKEWHEYDKYNDIGPSIEEYIKYVNSIRQPQYPKNYEECCKVLGYSGNYNMILTTDVDNKLFDALYRLKVCRDAYWKLYGEQMGLGKPWGPDWLNPDVDLFVIINVYNRVEKAKYGYGFQHCILTFPTSEMRDAFYENFKDFIEDCKELL